MAYLSPGEAAEILNVKPEAIRRMLRDGELRGTKVGNQWRVREEDLPTVRAASLRDAVLLEAADRHLPMGMLMREILYLAKLLVPEPLMEEAEEIMDQAIPLFKEDNHNTYYIGPEAGDRKRDFADRGLDGDESWLEEILGLYEEDRLEETAMEVMTEMERRIYNLPPEKKEKLLAMLREVDEEGGENKNGH